MRNDDTHGQVAGMMQSDEASFPPTLQTNFMHFFSGQPTRPCNRLPTSTQHSLLFRVFNELKTLISITHKTNLNIQTYMKKYLVTLAAMALAMGGSINFVGCGGEGDFTPSTNDQQGVEITGEKDKADAEKLGYNPGPPGGSRTDDGGGKKED